LGEDLKTQQRLAAYGGFDLTVNIKSGSEWDSWLHLQLFGGMLSS
jgi:hypothetical protein